MNANEEVGAFREYLQSRGLSPRTIYEYTHDLHSFLSEYPDAKPEDLERWLRKLSENGLKL